MLCDVRFDVSAEGQDICMSDVQCLKDVSVGCTDAKLL